MKRSRSEGSGQRVRTILEEIHPEFVEAGARQIAHTDVESLLERADEVLAAFSGAGALGRYRVEAGRMLDLVRDYRAEVDRAVPFWTVSVISFALLYVLKPVDIIPDLLPVIGQLDDAVVVGHAFEMVREQLDLRGERETRVGERGA